jgi:putative ABC transport system permease protein
MRTVLNIREAWRAIRANTLRSVLTTLGVVFGVASVIVMISIGAGTQQRIREDIEKLGPNTFTINPAPILVAGIRTSPGTGRSLTDDDAAVLSREFTHVDATPIVRVRAHMVSGGWNWSSWVLGITTDYLRIKDWNVANGRSLGFDEVGAGAKAVILGATVAGKLFPNDDPVGRDIRINHLSFRVIGVLAPKGETVDGLDLDDVALVPLAAARNHLAGRQSGRPRAVSAIVVKVDPAFALEPAKVEIRDSLRVRHGLVGGKEDGFLIHDMAQIHKLQEASSSALTILLASVASISLLTGGIGIMNIMLVSVTERTREIGIRGTIGASPNDILVQFLVEAVMLSMLGAALGVLLGIAGASIAENVFNLRTALSIEPVVLASSFAALVGIAFGYYPAWKASRLPPVEALRYE